MKLYRIIIFKNGKEETRATGNNLDKLLQWAKECQKQDQGINYEVYEEV